MSKAMKEFLEVIEDEDFSDILTDVLGELQRRVKVINQANGWYDDERDVLGDGMLIVTEVAEAMECYRQDEMDSEYTFHGDRIGPEDVDLMRQRGFNLKPVGFPSECADILIRLVDMTERTGVVLGKATVEKLEYNATRGYKHGGKKA